MLTSMNHSQGSIGGLSHLMEAASALTKLNVSPPPSPSLLLGEKKEKNCKLSAGGTVSQEANLVKRSIVSDDDEEKKSKPLKSSSSSSSSREIFPRRLMALLDDSSLSSVISWLPHGKSFIVLRPDVFSETVLPKYFGSNDSSRSSSSSSSCNTTTTTKYPSFTRRLNRWGFKQATRGPDTGAFHHPLFTRDNPDACLDMVCQKSRKRSSSSSSSKKNVESNASSTRSEASRFVTPRQNNNSMVAAAPSQQQNSTSTAATALPTTSNIAGATITPVVAIHTPQHLQQQHHHQQQQQPHHGLNIILSSPSPSQPFLSQSLQHQQPTLTLVAGAVPQQQQQQLLLTTPPQATIRPYASYLPSDPVLVASALKAREDMERINAAKSMLYDAYMKALQQGH